MDSLVIYKKIEEIYKGFERDVPEENENIFTPQTGIPANYATYLFVKLADEFNLDLNDVIPKIEEYTLKNIVEAIITSQGCNLMPNTIMQ